VLLHLLAVSVYAVAMSGTPITREDFVREYVLCNNRAWTGMSHELIPLVRRSASAAVTGTRSPEAVGFMEMEYLWGDRKFEDAAKRATLGWAAATKAYADDGGIEPRFRTGAAARAYLERLGDAT
jgi:hypothetical protein